MRKKICLTLLLLLTMTLNIGCGQAADSRLVVGTSADYAPFEFLYADSDKNMQFGGIDISVAQTIADSMGRELSVQNMSFDYLLTNLQKGDFDMVISAMEADETRSKAVDFSEPYYTDVPPMILVRAADAERFHSTDDFAGCSVGAQAGTTKEDIVTEKMPGAKLVSLALVTDLVNQLTYRKIDAIVLDGAVAQQYAQSNAQLSLADVSLGESTFYSIAVQKGDPKNLLPAINAAIAKMQKNDSIAQFAAQANALSNVWMEVTGETGEESISPSSFFNFTFVPKYWAFFLEALEYTLLLAVVSVLLAILPALLLALMRLSKHRPVRMLSGAYIAVFRSTPLLVQLSIIYFGVFNVIQIPSVMLFGFIDLSRFLPGVVALALNSSAYVAEIFRAGILAVDAGQNEAARSLGLSASQSMRSIVLPQAIKNVLPALANEIVTMVKESSICSTLGMAELMFAAKTVANDTFVTMGPYVLVALVYFCINYPASKAIEAIERRMRRGEK